MLLITIPPSELYNSRTNEFINSSGGTLRLEHSLVSVSKWEAKYHKPFLTKEPKTPAESIEYIKCMTLTQNVDDKVYNGVNDEIIDQVDAYLKDSMTASWITKEDQKTSRETVTSELIYYWMIALGIPMECQKWHLNRLFMLIQICNEKNKKPKKMGTKDLAIRNRALNAARKKKYHTRG